MTTSYPRTPDDPAGGFVRASAQWLAGQGHTVEVVAAGPGMTDDGAVRISRVSLGSSLFYDEGAPDRLERQPFRAAAAPLFVAGLAAAVARGRWDAIVSHWLLPCGAVAAARRLPHLAIAHSADVALALRLGVARPLARWLGGARVVFVAAHLRDAFVFAAGGPLHADVCPMGVTPPRPMDRGEARRRLGLDDRKVVAFLGRRVPIKGIDVLLRAAATLDAELLVGGEGPVPVTGARVRGLGELRGRDRDALFAAADVMAVPSREIGERTEGAPQVVVEAMAAGVPLVASDLPGIRELCAGAALLVPPGDAAALAAALRRALATPDPARVAEGRRRAAALGWESIGPRLLGVVDSLAHDARRSRRFGGGAVR